LALAAGVGLTACSHFCTDMSCQSGLRIQVVPASGKMPAGKYAIEVWTPFETGHFSCEVLQDVQGPSPCNCESTAQTIGACVTGWDAHIWVGGGPPSATVRIWIDGQLVLARDVDPHYRTERPNGPDCEPTCEVASEELKL